MFEFDALARTAIDATLGAIANETGGNPDYVVEAPPDSWAARTRCSLTIKNRDPRKAQLSATFAITEISPGIEVRVEQSVAAIENGTPRVIATLKWADVTREHVERLARKFVKDFFRQISQMDQG